jgi:hypothetical protein
VKRSEWIEAVKAIKANWPHGEVPPESLAKWYEDLKDLGTDQVRAAVEAIYRDGREFPPNGAQIRNKATELAEPISIEWSRGYRLATQLPGRTEDGRSLTWLYRASETMAWLQGEDPVAAETVSRLGVQVWAERLIADEGMWRANFRDIYREVAASSARERRYEGLPRGPKRGTLRSIGEIAREVVGE